MAGDYAIAREAGDTESDSLSSSEMYYKWNGARHVQCLTSFANMAGCGSSVQNCCPPGGPNFIFFECFAPFDITFVDPFSGYDQIGRFGLDR
jgi:hypothetical protein